jgi:hypothetical protein
MKRHAAIEPIIGHVNPDHRMNRNYLKDNNGNHNNAILTASAYNIRKLIRWFYCTLIKLQKLANQNLNKQMDWLKSNWILQG